MGKKVLLSLAFVVVALTAFAQTESEHLKFKGVPIDGTLREYVSKMESAGFSYLGEDDGTALLEGEFAGVKGCTVGVSVLKSTNVVYFQNWIIGLRLKECICNSNQCWLKNMESRLIVWKSFNRLMGYL